MRDKQMSRILSRQQHWIICGVSPSPATGDGSLDLGPLHGVCLSQPLVAKPSDAGLRCILARMTVRGARTRHVGISSSQVRVTCCPRHPFTIYTLQGGFGQSHGVDLPWDGGSSMLFASEHGIRNEHRGLTEHTPGRYHNSQGGEANATLGEQSLVSSCRIGIIWCFWLKWFVTVYQPLKPGGSFARDNSSVNEHVEAYQVVCLPRAPRPEPLGFGLLATGATLGLLRLYSPNSDRWESSTGHRYRAYPSCAGQTVDWGTGHGSVSPGPSSWCGWLRSSFWVQDC
ncbi:hypothetical protein GE09DRAFT_655925 [Coniochaeta sp. 2T2.1]|nr:hypothetical protein GE09DRAFT_655925 [Coniochaeta sp. 2T2.1]